MITKLLNEVNENIETLNNLVQDKEYFEKLDGRIEKVNNCVRKQKQEIEKLHSIIKEAREYIEKYLYEHIIDDLPDEESKFETEDGVPIPNAKEQLLNILDKGSDKE